MATLLVVIVGCGLNSGEYPLAPVSGKVTLDNRPLADAYVIFEPVLVGRVSLKRGGPPGSFAKTDDNGHYELHVSINGQQGAVVGPHVVRITKAEQNTNAEQDGENSDVQDIVPPAYNLATSLRFSVPEGGTMNADFVLTSGGS